MREILTETFGALLGVLSAAAVIVLMAIVVTTVASSNSLDSFSKPELVDTEIEIFANALNRFQTDIGRYPTIAEGLAVRSASRARSRIARMQDNTVPAAEIKSSDADQ